MTVDFDAAWKMGNQAWKVVGPVLGYVVGFTKESRSKEKEFLRDSVYSPAFEMLVDIEHGLKESWFVPRTPLATLQHQVKSRIGDHMVGRYGNRLEEVCKRLTCLASEGEEFVIATRLAAVKVSNQFAPVKGHAKAYPDPCRMRWPQVVAFDASPLVGVAGAKNLEIKIPTDDLQMQSHTVTVYADALKVSWENFFAELRKGLRNDPVVAGYSSEREELIPLLGELVSECRRRKVTPISFFESHNPWLRRSG